MHSGDPFTNSGWLQYFEVPPCDVQMVNGSGTFSMAPSDTQRIIYAIIVGHGKTRLESVSDLKRNANFVRDAFRTEFKLNAIASAEVDFISETSVDFNVTAQISGSIGFSEVKAELYSYDNTLFHSIMLYDDGQHNDGLANDNIFGNTWATVMTDTALYLNLKILGVAQKEYLFQHCVDNITLISNRLSITAINVVADHLNESGTLNPGETARLTYIVRNNFPFEIGTLNAWMTTDDPYVQVESRHQFFSNILPGENQGINYDGEDKKTYFVVSAYSDIPDTHTFFFDVAFRDNHHHSWYEKDIAKLRLEPLDYVPNQIIPNHISGHSSAKFVISVMRPDELTGHSYAITVDDIDEYRRGFNLIDHTLGDTLLNKQPVPDEFAFNIPMTDGFKIVEAYLPEDRAKWAYEDIIGGHSNPFWGLGINYGEIEDENFYDVELEFVNYIDSSGVIGDPIGQGGFYYKSSLSIPGDQMSFVSCPFNVWQMDNRQRMNKLNVCFTEHPYVLDGIWTPGDRLYIMKSDYDSSGQYYYDPGNNPKEDIMYDFMAHPILDSSIVDPGDKITISREFSATKDDVWMFVPTGIIKRNAPKPNSFALHQNYPNPFNPTTTIRFSLNKASLVNLQIYNMIGQQVIELFNEETGTGNYMVHWDGKNNIGQSVSSGLYFARLISKDKIQTIKLLLIR